MIRQYELRRYHDLIVCSATHPHYPNYDDRARSRVDHLFDGSGEKYAFPATLCGMLATGFKQEVQDCQRSICRQCDKAAPKSAKDTVEHNPNGPTDAR